MTHTYTPHAGSIAAQCITYFRGNPAEELTMEDIVVKFGATRPGIHTLLRPALDAGFLARRRDQDGDYYYSAGKQLFDPLPAAHPVHAPAPSPVPASPVAAAPKPPAPTHKTGQSSIRKMIDIDALVVETGVPFMGTSSKGQSKWTPLFDRLKRKGESLVIPIDFKGAVASAALKHNKTHPGNYTVAVISKTVARVWRNA